MNRNAAALRCAAENNIAAADLGGFLEKNGIAECAKRDRDSHPTGASRRAEEKRAALLEAGRETGVVFDAPSLRKIVKPPFASLLVEPIKGGKFRIIGLRAEAESVITRYSPLKR